jgi:hypothetical protein
MNAADRRQKASTLEQRLVQLGFKELFQRLTHDALGKVWGDGAARGLLEQVVLDPSRDPLARFLAAEILFARLSGYPPASALPALASVYATALAGNLAGMANPWGLPGDTSAQVARHVVALGEVAVPSLSPLLGDARPMSYSGSRDATTGNRYDYRVKDIAASLIAAIRGERLIVDVDAAKRDRAIEGLRLQLSQKERP